MMKPGNGGYNASGDCEKGSGSVANCLGLCLARVREIWQIGRVVVRDFSRRQQTPLEHTRKINELDALIWRSPAILIGFYAGFVNG